MEIIIEAEKIFAIWGFPVTNTLLTTWMVVAFFIVLVSFLQRHTSLVPQGLQNLLEFVIEMFLGLMEGIFGSREKAEKYFPLIATIFLLVLCSNWLGIFPGFGSLGFWEEHEGRRMFVPLFRSAASDLNFTLALGIIAVFSVQAFGIAAIGFVKYAKKYFTFSNPLLTFVGLLEFLSEIVKIFSFSFRLFGNVFAGEVLLLSIAALAPYIVPLPFLFLEVFVGFVQALVFAMLTLVFIGMAVTEHSEEHQ
ncbi:MAG: ATP synthase F0 subunit A [Candidatus Sungbacteria bacterium RIFCSPLOWO2_02_FULL_51_17]|uniref:ATP synthase subunit a n=1 Tax=Candidatus Sungbacteria bacterium RIFCSPHIGHO2_02_FULL_51_29 TaxID=1802273 RepID=A0A1G2KR76_9BACT|nr:MAG: ATP synthase F0 subunit A [Candidatus Sungbacteria bacterium RIFCSPHIGHO2_01_FULL_51_22]OHA01925.1 MAG: ATP synthase F0 subunit A [Candidatus Sungbacteria bacterium RIFCSPHIGHO2_02_FULL_51_29]OHA05830.1 MAG: ATP synthase F0 subunit A [Candidatus Sungbacteria bacterium RIFCSPLOWO2_01_FULL_51_34]OHA11743.1 MAG: ATP synthase F0 subunit A [Candidatus Sungbacteria bacterium RIFCSPLOWO2_02_FULL_51_17]